MRMPGQRAPGAAGTPTAGPRCHEFIDSDSVGLGPSLGRATEDGLRHSQSIGRSVVVGHLGTSTSWTVALPEVSAL